MQLESETIDMMMLGYFLVIGLCIVVIVRLYFKYKCKSLFWFIGQLVFLTFAFFKFIHLIQIEPQIPELMQSEENSLNLGITGLLWAVSMFCMMAGIYFVLTRKTRD